MNPVHQARKLVERHRRTVPWIAVSGGKGGVGKTLLAVNLAILAARSGRRVLLADLDPGLANVNVHLRLAPERCLEDAASGACDPSAAATAAPGGFTLLPGLSGSQRLASDPGFVTAALDVVAALAADHDLVLCDTGAGIGPAVLRTLLRADLTLLVTTPDPAAVTDAYALIKVLAGETARPAHVVVNRVAASGEATQTATRLRTVCRKFLGIDVPLAGWVADDAACARSVLDQRPLALDDDAAVLTGMRSVLAHALAALPNGTAPKTSTFERLGRATP